MEKLKPCFRCHSEIIEICDHSDVLKTQRPFFIICLSCLCRSAYYRTKEEAIDWWNKRPTSWISVKERKPQISEVVHIFTIYGFARYEYTVIQRRENKIGFKNEKYHYTIDEVTHFMYPVEPPEDEL